MGRGAKRHGGGRSGSKSGIEKYGRDEIDEALGFDSDDGGASEGAAADSGDEYEEEVMARSEEEDEDDQSFKKAMQKKKKAAQKAKKGEAGEQEDEEGGGASKALDPMKEAVASGTVGWRGQDFYGGDDAAGDSSDGGSEEELTFQEAKRLEELRAQRLGGLAMSDPMSVLLGDAEVEAVGAPSAHDSAAAAEKPARASGEAVLSAAGITSRFESVFAAKAEHASVKRDLSQLSDSKKRALVKKEAPELLSLLEDYKSKLFVLKELLPLLKPKALAQLPASGAAYLQTKAALLLNTLANLAFYVLLRAEGGSVRTHPVVSQLVWLKELHEKVAPLDAKLKPKLRKATKAAIKVLAAAEPQEDEEEARGAPGGLEAQGASEDHDTRSAGAPRKLRLRERLDRLRAAEAAAKARVKPSAAAAGARAAAELDTADLLRLPGRRRRVGAGGAPVDLDEDDPTLGMWMPQSSMSEQLHSVRQYLGEGVSRSKKVSADLDVEARPRRARQRVQEDPEVAEATSGRQRRPPGGLDDGGALADDLEDGGELIRQALDKSRRKKETRSAQEVAKEEARLLRQHRPEEAVEGRRKTSKRILDNRGLVRQRKSKAGNARVANRQKYDKMVKRRKGAVQEMRQGAADGTTYEGEATGVRTHIKKSKKLG